MKVQDWTQAQRCNAAAHLGHIACSLLHRGLNGRGGTMLSYASDVLTEHGPGDYYREALLESGVLFDECDVAVAAILAGKHPPDSLVGQVERYRGKAVREYEEQPAGTERESHCEGESHALAHVLSLLGVKVTP